MEETRPVEITTTISSDETSLGSGPHRAREGTTLAPIEESTTQNASSQGPPNMIGVIATLKVDAAKKKARVRKMPAMDRNLESLTSEEVTGFQRSS
jgi:hypothetical protein